MGAADATDSPGVPESGVFGALCSPYGVQRLLTLLSSPKTFNKWAQQWDPPGQQSACGNDHRPEPIGNSSGTDRFDKRHTAPGPISQRSIGAHATVGCWRMADHWCPPVFVVGRAARRPNRRGDAHIATEETRVNERIRVREVLLIGPNGEQLGVKSTQDAMVIARSQDLDLVEVAASANPPVCRIMDFKRFEYEQQQRRKESRKKASNIVVKEMKFRPKIDGHDYETKMKHVARFLKEGSKVKLTIMFRGREMAHPELGRKILERVAVDVGEIAFVESAPKQDGRNMVMVLNPAVKKKASTKPASVPETPSDAPSEVAVTTAAAEGA